MTHDTTFVCDYAKFFFGRWFSVVAFFLSFGCYVTKRLLKKSVPAIQVLQLYGRNGNCYHIHYDEDCDEDNQVQNKSQVSLVWCYPPFCCRGSCAREFQTLKYKAFFFFLTFASRFVGNFTIKLK